MIKNILLALVAFVLLSLVVLWILNRGPQRIFASVKDFSFIGATSTGGFGLPWQPANLFPYVDEEDLFGPGASSVAESNDPEAELAEIQEKYNEILKNANDVMTFGDPSPHFRDVRIVPAYSNIASENNEYISIEARLENTSPVSLSGWSLQSALTGVRISIPHAATTLQSGNVNDTNPVSLAPGTYAIVASGSSPLGISFRENMCTGYLAEYQSFEPPLPLQCPSPSSEMPLNAENLKKYGDECFDFVRSLPTCEFPKTIPSSITQTCRSFLQNTLSYGGCVNRHRADASFLNDSWRLYLGSSADVWRNTHDAIRLLDEEGKTVDVYVY